MSDTIMIEGQEYVSLKIAAEILSLTDQTLKNKIDYLTKNGVRAYRLYTSFRGMKLCRADLEQVKKVALETGYPITEVVINS